MVCDYLKLGQVFRNHDFTVSVVKLCTVFQNREIQKNSEIVSKFPKETEIDRIRQNKTENYTTLPVKTC